LFHLLQPIWLFSTAAIAIPVIIHLWNIREGKTLQVGSISLIQESARQQARSLKLKDLLLLILRCLILMALAFLLAKPTWQKQLTTTKEKGWILIEKQGLHAAYANFKQSIDSLIKAGYKFHYFNQGFEAVKFEDAIKNAGNKAGDYEAYWTLLKVLNEQVPQELPVYLFTDNKLKRFAGSRPAVSMNLKWLTYNSTDTSGKAILTAYKSLAKDVRVIIANSNRDATYYSSESAANNVDFNVTTNKGNAFINVKDSTTNHTLVDTASTNIKIYTDEFHLDANYVKAAFDAIQQYTSLPIKASIINNINQLKQEDRWLFWLSENTLPTGVNTANIFVYEKGKEQSTNSIITAVNNSSLSQDQITVSKIIRGNGTDFKEIVWKDGFGLPLLSLERANSNVYRFNSRLNPGWNDLTWNNGFAEMLFNLVVRTDESIKNFDDRVIDAQQMEPVLQKSKGSDKENFVETIDLSKAFWLLAFILFFLERNISLNHKRELYG
jgi:hypothetical protein